MEAEQYTSKSDLGISRFYFGSSKYSNEIFEGSSGEAVHGEQQLDMGLLMIIDLCKTNCGLVKRVRFWLVTNFGQSVQRFYFV